MRYLSGKISSIPPDAIRILSQYGIDDTDGLLQALSLPHQRKILSKQTGFSEEELTQWVGIADLVRVKGMGVKTAELFVLSGIAHSVQEFIDCIISPPTIDERGKTGWEMLMSGIKTFWNKLLRKHETHLFQPDNWRVRLADRSSVQIVSQTLRKRLLSSKPANFPTSSIPSARKLAEMVEEAQELRPRMAVMEMNTNEVFRKEMKERYKKLGLKNLKYSFFVLGLVATLVSVILATIYVKYLSQAPEDSPYLWIRLHNVLFHESGTAVFQSMILFSIILLLMGFLAMVSYNLLSFSSSYFFSTRLMSNTVHQSFFRRAMDDNVQKEERAIRFALSLLILGLVTVGVYFIRQNFEWDYENLNQHAGVVAIFGIAFGFVASSSSMTHLMVGVRIDWEKEKESFKRVLAYMLSLVLGAPAIGIIVVIFLLFTTKVGFEKIYGSYVLPDYLERLDRVCQEEALKTAQGDATSASYHETLELCIYEIEPEIISDTVPFLYMGNSEDLPLSLNNTFIIWALNNLLIWMLLSGVALMFVVPYLSLGGVWKGLFYILLLIAASGLENLLRSNSAEWLGLDASALSTLLLVWFFILVIALVFDWFYETITESQKICPACQTLIDDTSYCPICGMAQKT